eukprot:TRINITY_DN67924_c0_g1_i1.p1 TRINITY_DN67924_c0_g1~~TRINITY_DN67924_c0_g1_i1.p1  ORF type:complete len:290 (+),score=30.89 TRINITY_DN67924_c0_g1_i1:30-899(+)
MAKNSKGNASKFRFIDAQAFYNLYVSHEHHLIDLRPEADFQLLHLAEAANLPRGAAVHAFIASNREELHNGFNDRKGIVILCAESPLNTEAFAGDPFLQQVRQYYETAHPLSHSVCCLAECGIDAFMQARPYLTEQDGSQASGHWYPNQVLPRLYVGSSMVAEDLTVLKQLGICHVVNCAAELRNHFTAEGVRYCNVPVHDESLDTEAAALVSTLEDVCEFVAEAHSRGGSVLVHCQRGKSRSGAVLIGYLMLSKGMEYRSAYQHVKQCRECIEPNPAFVAALQTLQSR